ncbi:MAG: hypothetical protein LUC18_00990 [Porphyromonadaceae bacterium]|nr:hypothetical protein [Porphyromonadaceae bacterium]
MKRILCSALVLLLTVGAVFAQNCEIRWMSLSADEDEQTPPIAKQFLCNRLGALMSAGESDVVGPYAQFYITSKSSVMSEQLMGSAPPKTSLVLLLTLYIGDSWGEKIFAQTSLELRGAGNSREQAYLNAYRSLNGNNAQLKSFFEEGKQKVLSYYDSEYPRILKEAQRLASLKEYDNALFLLSAVPVCCKGYEEVSDALSATYQAYVDYTSLKLLQQARMAWAASPDRNGAEAAAEYLLAIEPFAACYDEAMALYTEMKTKVREDWDFEMRQKYTDELEIRKLEIEKAKAVGVAFGNNQQPRTTNIIPR